MTLLELFQLLRKHIRWVIIVPVICALVTAVICFAFLPNEYTASTSVYVLSKSSDTENSISNTELTASQMLTNDVAELITSDRVESDTARAVGLSSLDDFDISVESSTSTRVITISVTGKDAEGAAKVANGLAQDVSAVAQEVMNVQSVNVIDEAVAPSSPSGPNRILYTIVAFLVGLFAVIVVVVILDSLNTRVRSSEEAEQLIGLPVIGRIPSMKGER
jgi:capsular polysaccharide biosynthesis protein